MKRQILALSFILVFLAAAPLRADDPPAATKGLKTPFTSVVAFGDSFSDNGFADGHGFKRYTETLTWVEYLAQWLNLPLEDRAWGGAMSNERNCNHPEGVNWSGLIWQVDGYIKDMAPGQDISKVLFTVMVGSNDVWAGMEDGAVTAKNIRQAASNLAKAGARHILYRETSAILMSPGYLAGDYASYNEPWTKLVNTANAATKKELLEGLAKDFPGLKIYYHASDPLFTKIKEGREGFKFEILDKPWWGTYTLPEPYKYLWYDEWNPSGQAHRLIAEDSLKALKEALP